MLGRWPLALWLCATAMALSGCTTTSSTGGDDALTASSTSTAPSDDTCGPVSEFLGQCVTKSTCPDHWHATYAVFVPTGERDAAGNDVPKRLDWESPMTASGRHYYDFGNNPKMSLTMHMHQSGSEAGSDALGPAQIHYEGGKCVGMQRSFATIDLEVEADSLSIVADSPLAASAANQGGPWSDAGDQTLRFFLETQGADGQWSWAEEPLEAHLPSQLQDGEAVLLTFGDYADATIDGLQAQVPPPISRTYTPDDGASPPR